MWFSLLPAFLTLGALVLVPGLAVGYALGLRGLSAWGMAPPLTVSLLSVLGVVAGLAHVPWSPLVLVAGTVVLAGVAALLARLFHLRVWRHKFVDSTQVRVAGLLGVLLGAVLQGAATMRGIGLPDSLSNSPDSTFHLNRLRLMMDLSNISSVNGGFYPSGWHDLMVTWLQLHPLGLIEATNVAAVLMAALIWPLGCVALARQVFGPRPLALVATGLTSAAFLAFPSFLLSWGVLWPNTLGLALVPAALAMAVAAVRPVHQTGLRRRTAGLALVLAVPGIFLAHPNAILTLGVLVLTVLAAAAIQAMIEGDPARRRRGALWLTTMVVATLVAVVVLPRISSRVAAVSAYDWKPTETVPDAGLDMLLNAPHDGPFLWGLSAFVLLGAIVVVARYRSLLWAVVSFVVFSVLYMMAAAVGTPVTQLFTGYWYNDSVRIAASNAIPGCLLAVVGMGAVLTGLRRLVDRTPAAAEARRPLALRAGIPALVGLLFVAATVGANHGPEARMIDAYYHPKETARRYVSASQIASWVRIAQKVPKGAVVSDFPANGSALIYALGGRQVLFTSLNPSSGADRLTIGRYLDQVAHRPDVCDALRRMRVTYAVTGPSTFWAAKIGREDRMGMVHLAGKPGFKRVAVEDHYALYKITACGLG